MVDIWHELQLEWASYTDYPGGLVTIHSSGHSLTEKGIMLDAFEEIYEVAGIASVRGKDGIGEVSGKESLKLFVNFIEIS
jgi:hypothetical protein